MLAEAELCFDVELERPAPPENLTRAEREAIRPFCDSMGKVRWSKTAGRVDLEQADGRNLVASAYKGWVLNDEYIVLHGVNETSGDHVYLHEKLRKRGNDVDTARMERKLCGYQKVFEKHTLNEPRLSNTLYLTLTYNPKRYRGSLEEAWHSLSPDWNRFLSALRKRYGGVRQLRSYECHKSGWPHIHVLIQFEKAAWPTIEHVGENGILSLRIPYDEKERIAKLWPHGYVDVNAVGGGRLSAAIRDVVWYIAKSTASDADYTTVGEWKRKRLLTVSTLWYLHMRSWSVSRDVEREAAELSATDLSNAVCVIQTNPYGEGWTFEAVGLIARENILIPDKQTGRTAPLDRRVHLLVWTPTAEESEPPWIANVWKPQPASPRGREYSDWFGKRDAHAEVIQARAARNREAAEARTALERSLETDLPETLLERHHLTGRAHEWAREWMRGWRPKEEGGYDDPDAPPEGVAA